MDVPLVAAGSWTQRRKSKKAGLEPDQCYALGVRRPKRPQLAVEVVWSSPGIDKLDIYARLGIPEVCFWERDRLEVHVLRRARYVRSQQSALLPELDLKLLARYVRRSDQLQAIRQYRAAVRGQRRH
jgi:Uma2 family endonuclease